MKGPGMKNVQHNKKEKISGLVYDKNNERIKTKPGNQQPLNKMLLKWDRPINNNTLRSNGRQPLSKFIT